MALRLSIHGRLTTCWAKMRALHCRPISRQLVTAMEVSPYYTALDDLAARTDVLRGYL